MRKIFPETEDNANVLTPEQFLDFNNQIKALQDKNTEQDTEIANLQNKTSYTGLTEVSSDNVTTPILNSDNIVNTGNIGTDTIEASTGDIDDLTTDNLSAENATIQNADINSLTVGDITVTGTTAYDEVNIDDAGIDDATINNAEINVADIETLSADNVEIKENLTVTEKVTSATLETGIADITTANVDSLNADAADFGTMESDSAEIDSAKIDSIQNKEIIHSDHYMTLSGIQDNNDYYWIKIPAFKSGNYTITLIATADSIGANEGEPLLSVTVTNAFDNISFKYSKNKIAIMDDVLIKDDCVYFKIHDNGKLYFSWNVLESVNNPASYLNNCPIDPDTAEYSVTLDTKYGDIYTHYVIAQNLNEGGGGSVVTNKPLTASAASDVANAIPTGEGTVEYNGESAEALSIYVPDQNVNTTSDVTFGDVDTDKITTKDNSVTVRKDSNTAVAGVSGVTVENYNGEGDDLTFGVDSEGRLCLGDTIFGEDTFVNRTQLPGTEPTGTLKAYVEEKTAGGSTVSQVPVEEEASASESIPLRASDGSLKALMPSTVEDETLVNNEYLEDYVDDLTGAAYGIAPLDGDTLLPEANLPSVPKTKLPEGMMTYKGNDWDASDGFPEDADPTYTPATGDYWECGTGGTIDGVVYRVGDIIVYTGSAWKKQGGSSGAPLSDLLPSPCVSLSGIAGIGDEAARYDHKHPIPRTDCTVICTTATGSADRMAVFGPDIESNLETGITARVLFTNGYYLDNSTDIPKLSISPYYDVPRKIYVYKDGQLITLPTHLTTRSESIGNTAHYWVLQAGTVLNIMYDSTLDNDNGGWVVLDNPVVLSSTSSSQSYTVKANGLTVDTGYTTEEQFTGKYWIDGKPVYKKVINDTLTVPQEGSVQLKPWSDFSNIDTLIKLDGTFKQTAGGNITFFRMNDSGARLYIAQSGSPNGLVFDSKNGRTNVPYQVIIEYTKI